MTTWDAGMVVTADRLNDGPLYVWKTSNETVTNSSTLQNDDDLFVSVVANAIYDVRLKVFYSAPTANDLKVGFSWPSGGTCPWGILGLDGSATSSTGSLTAAAFDTPTSGVSSFTLGGGGPSNTLYALIEATLTTAGTAGQLRLMWSEITAASGTSAVVKAGSVMRAERMG